MEKIPKRRETKLVQLDVETAKQLNGLGQKGDTYDQIVRKLAAFWVAGHGEAQDDQS